MKSRWRDATRWIIACNDDDDDDDLSLPSGEEKYEECDVLNKVVCFILFHL